MQTQKGWFWMIQKDYWKRTALWGFWDNKTPLDNPHKGWYLHYYDNGITKYFDAENPEDYLMDFPCFNHVYLRLGWCYLEPEEGQYNWEMLDEVIRRWWAKGRKVTFRVSCKETGSDQAFATPKWVFEKAGAKGEYTTMYGSESFEPDYGDPIFLEKLENFMQALAARYDGAPFLEFVDIGSFGEWGECHTEGSSDRAWPIEVMKEHVDIHTRAFKKTTVLGNYDMVCLRRTYDGTEEEIQDYMVAEGLGNRIDSGCVGFYSDRYGLSSNHTPWLFEPYWRTKPIDLEFCHYTYTPASPNWDNGYRMIAAAHEIHPTFAGFHGYARKWLGDNAHFAEVYGNLIGYWYFLQTVYLPETIGAGQRLAMGAVWENRGSAPAYTRYKLYLKLVNPKTGESDLINLREADCRKWLPIEPSEEMYSIRPRKDLTPGTYDACIGLFEEIDYETPLPEGYTWPECEKFEFPGRPIKLALRKELACDDGFYRVGSINVTAYERPFHEGVVTVGPLWPGHPKSQEGKL